MKAKIEKLIHNIEKSNLSDIDKRILIECIEGNDPDLHEFILRFLAIVEVSSKIIKIFEIDIGDLINNF